MHRLDLFLTYGSCEFITSSAPLKKMLFSLSVLSEVRKTQKKRAKIQHKALLTALVTCFLIQVIHAVQ